MLLSLFLSAVSCIPLPICLDNGNVSPCATPTPVLAWDQVPDADLRGYRVYVDGVLLVDLPCEWADLDENGTLEHRFCRGADLGIPLQRYCGFCLMNISYAITVKAYYLVGNESVTPSNTVGVCMSPLCLSPGPCS